MTQRMQKMFLKKVIVNLKDKRDDKNMMPRTYEHALFSPCYGLFYIDISLTRADLEVQLMQLNHYDGELSNY